MSHMKVSGAVAVVATAMAFAAGAYGDTGKSPNGAPGPAGNPNPPAATPQANAPQGPAGNAAHGRSGTAGSNASHGKRNASHGKSGASHGKSNASHGKSNASHGKAGAAHPQSRGKSGSAPSRSNGSHANPTPGTPRNDNGNNGHAGKITICHATRSTHHPYVEITISVNGLNGHGPADAPRHHAGSWKDIIPAPADGCPSTVEQPSGSTSNDTGTVAPKTTTATTGTTDTTEAAKPGDVAGFRVLGARAAGGNAPAAGAAPQSAVLGAQASGSKPASATLAAHSLNSGRHGSLPFTGFQLAVVLLAAAAALLGGFALRRATARNRA